MLSILIPIYNFDVNELVKQLHAQATKSGIVFEIRCYDDKSDAAIVELNEPIRLFLSTTYKKLDKNIGRSRIRNLLAEEAQYENLIFIDCDSKIVSENYIEDYLKSSFSFSVICGGRSYCKKQSENKNKLLHWKYGVNREVIHSQERSKYPYDSFMTNNFLIKKKIFLAIKLDEWIIGYGHEDTQFGYMLKQGNVKILHIENALEHIGLEDSETFILKSTEAVKNLFLLFKSNHIPKESINKIALLRYFSILKKSKTRKLFVSCYELVKPKFHKNLLSTTPRLFIFDLYKLYVLIKLSLDKDYTI